MKDEMKDMSLKVQNKTWGGGGDGSCTVNIPIAASKLARDVNTRIRTYYCIFISLGLSVLAVPRPPLRYLDLVLQHLVGLLCMSDQSEQGLYLHRTTQHRNTRTDIHALRAIQTNDRSIKTVKTLAPKTERPLWSAITLTALVTVTNPSIYFKL
jgi:hypothetical protein